MTENMSVLQKEVLCPDSDRERFVSPLGVRYSRDKLEFDNSVLKPGPVECV